MLTLTTLLLLVSTTFAQTLTTNTGPSATDPVITATANGAADVNVIVRYMAYPNPTWDFLNVEIEGQSAGDLRLRVEDTAGNEIYELFKFIELTPDYVGRLDMRDLERSVYFLIVETVDGKEISRHEIEKR
ncbi:MAG: hypothetical protein AAGN35_23285 [Bacteroidota bacterium]